MRKVIGIGETVLDIIFKGGQPVSAVPGGSVYNGIISLGRAGVPAAFISEVGDDRIGEKTVSFLKENGVDATFVSRNKGTKSPVSLAFLNGQNDAEYIFYKDHPHDRLDYITPEINRDDIVMLGSYYAVNPVIRPQVAAILNAARDRGRGSRDDFNVMYRMDTPDKVYNSEISFYCKKFVYTDGAADVELRGDNGLRKSYAVEATETVSTIGAGDNFNAGIVYGMMRYGVTRDMMDGAIPEQTWDNIIRCALAFSANCCRSIGNSVDKAFGEAMKKEFGNALKGNN